MPVGRERHGDLAERRVAVVCVLEDDLCVPVVAKIGRWWWWWWSGERRRRRRAVAEHGAAAASQ